MVRRSGALAVLLPLVVVAVVTLVAWQTAPRTFRVEGAGTTGNLTLARVVLFGIVAMLAWLVPLAVRRADRRTALVMAGWSAFLGFWWLALWPGIIVPDTIELVDLARSGVLFEWYGLLQSVLTMALLDVVPHAALMVGLQVAALAALLTWATLLTLDRFAGRLPVGVLVLGVLTSVALVVTVLEPTRDALYAVLHVALALWVAGIATSRRRPGAGELAGMALLVGALSAYRGDGVVLLVVVPLVLLVALRPDVRPALAGAAAFAAGAVLFHVALPAAATLEDRGHRYEVVLLMSPLGAVLQNDFTSTDRDRDLRELGRVIDVARVREIQREQPTQVEAYWQGAYRGDASEEDWRVFETAARRVLRNNVPAYLGNRLTVSAASAGLGQGAIYPPQYLTDRAADRVVSIRDLRPEAVEALTAEPPVLRLYTAAEDLIRPASEFRGLALRGTFLHWNLLPWLAVLLVCLVGFGRWTFEAVAAVVLLSRVPLLFAAAPVAQFRYYEAIHLGGIVLLPLLLAAVLTRRRTQRELVIA